ncbi:hypothetical protein M3661_29595 [Paenibacillus sp. MER 180]|uniref:hypothetical protein n=1 Tax=Paenibacillus sp. MER 180 TaxID=2939570 RepID=UPI00203AD81A|nr:hypothetical protein [Paenibacillus sp. MER 180]MCM3294244.1 hypothetical protein [Paenibacillus sp. MER 180]
MSKQWQKVKAVNDFVGLVLERSPKAFINSRDELIVEPKNNVYFKLTDIKTEMDLKAKVIAWLSRPSCKGVSPYFQKRIRGILNDFLGTNFSVDQMMVIYTYLGNGCNGSLCVQFIESGYDMSILAGRA